MVVETVSQDQGFPPPSDLSKDIDLFRVFTYLSQPTEQWEEKHKVRPLLGNLLK